MVPSLSRLFLLPLLAATIALLSGALIVATVTLLASQLHPSSVHGLAGLWTKVAEIVAGARGRKVFENGEPS